MEDGSVDVVDRVAVVLGATMRRIINIEADVCLVFALVSELSESVPTSATGHLQYLLLRLLPRKALVSSSIILLAQLCAATQSRLAHLRVLQSYFHTRGVVCPTGK